MEDNSQENNFISKKKNTFLGINVSKTTLIIIVCSLACFLLVLLAFSFMINNKKSQAKSFSRPSINAPRKPIKKDIEKEQQVPEQELQTQNFERDSLSQKQERSSQEYRTPRGIYKGETPEQAHERHMRQREAQKDPNYRRQMMAQAKERKRNRKNQDRRQSKNQHESNRPRLNS